MTPTHQGGWRTDTWGWVGVGVRLPVFIDERRRTSSNVRFKWRRFTLTSHDTAAHAKFFLMSFGNRYPSGAYTTFISRLLQPYGEMQFKGVGVGWGGGILR